MSDATDSAEGYVRKILEEIDTAIDTVPKSDVERANEVAQLADELSDAATTWAMMFAESDDVPGQ
jgi:hypothetical protein